MYFLPDSRDKYCGYSILQERDIRYRKDLEMARIKVQICTKYSVLRIYGKFMRDNESRYNHLVIAPRISGTAEYLAVLRTFSMFSRRARDFKI
jgi:hypothetical protein